jgi:hypothetical protein
MKTPMAWSLLLAAMAIVLGCESTPTREPTNGGGNGSATLDAPPPPGVEEGHEFLGGMVEVTKVDRKALAQGTVEVTLKSTHTDYLDDVWYQFTMFYPNADSSKWATEPWVPISTDWALLDLIEPGQSVVIAGRGKKGAKQVQLRVRQANDPRPTVFGQRLLGGRIEVVDIEKDLYSRKPKLRFKMKNVGRNRMFLIAQVVFLKDGKTFAKTEQAVLPDALDPGEEMWFEPDLRGVRVFGTEPALKLLPNYQ